jgi:ubiquinone/menaquinone biosynthesis C-methylase UbiE
MGFYSKHIFPRLMEWGLSAQPVMDLRVRALAPSRGRVLEIGFGTGLNIECYPVTVDELIALDSEHMIPERVRERITKSRFPVRQEWLDASLRLPFDNDSFDTVVTTFTICSIKDTSSALKEIQRVLRPQGAYLFLEHGRSDDPGVARWQDSLNPIQKLIAGGCNLNRKIDQLITASGLGIDALHRLTIPKAPRVFAEVYFGAARRNSPT